MSYSAATLGYLLGSPPFGFWRKMLRAGIRKLSGNIGTTNVFAILGGNGGWVSCCSMASRLACLFPFVKISPHGEAAASTMILFADLLLSWDTTTRWLGFKGEGIATSAGVLLFWTPWV